MIYDNAPIPGTKVDFGDEGPSIPANEKLTAAEFNQVTAALADVRALYQNGELRVNPNGATGVSASGMIRHRVNASGALELSENASSFYRPVTRFDVTKYGAKGDGVTDDTAAIQAAISAAMSAGGGVVFFPKTGHFYGTGTGIVHGVPYVNMEDVSLSAEGYPTPPSGYGSQAAASYNSTNATANTLIPHVCFEGEPGAAIGWLGASPAHETPLLAYYAQPNGSTPSSANVVHGYIRGLTFIGPDQISAGQFIVVAGTTIVTSKVSGVFVPGTSQILVENNNFYGVKRGIVTSDNYWSAISHNSVFRCVDGVTTFNHNAALLFSNVVHFASANGFIITGGGWYAIGCNTESAPCGINVPNADDFHIQQCYLESTNVSDTDSYIKLGQNSGGVNVTWGVLTNISISCAGAVNSKSMSIKSAFGVTFLNVRFGFNNLTSNPASIDSVSAFVKFINCNVPLDSATQANSTTMSNLSFISSSYDGGGRYVTSPSTSSEHVMFKDIYSQDGGNLTLHSDIADGAAAVAHVDDTNHLFSTPGSKIRSFRNNASEVAFIDKDGGISLNGVLQTNACRNLHRSNVNADVTLDGQYEVATVGAFSSNITVTLPAGAPNGRRYTIHRSDASSNVVTIQPAGGSGGHIVQQGSFVEPISLPSAGSITLMSEGSGSWYVISQLEIAPVGSTPNSNAASVIGQQLTLQPADETHPGIVTTGAQSFGGQKTLEGGPIFRGGFVAHGDGQPLVLAGETYVQAGPLHVQDDCITQARTERRVACNASRSLVINDDERVQIGTGGGSAVTVTLPASAPIGKRFIIGRDSDNTHLANIAPASGEQIGRLPTNGTLPISPSSWVTLSSNGAGLWDIADVHEGQLVLTAGTSAIGATTNAIICNPTAGNITVTLPSAGSTIEGMVYHFKRYADGTGNTVTIDAGAGGSTFDGGGTTQTIASGGHLALVCDGSTWWVVG